MKKILLILFALALTLTLSITAFGAEGEATWETEVISTEENIFTALYVWASDNAGEIFSLLTLVSSALLAFTYKKGLLPKLGGALGKISGAVGNISKSTEAALNSLGESYGSIKDTLSIVSGMCEGLSDEVSELSARLDESGDSKGELEKMKIILSSQVDMLYEIFISSALPQFAKEAVAERVNVMRRMLTGEESTNE